MIEEFLKVEIEIEIDPNTPLTEQVRVAIESELLQFLDYCDPVIRVDDSRYSILEDSLKLAEFEYYEHDLKGWMTFSFSVNFYAGCKDLDDYDEHTSKPFHFVVDQVKRKIIFDEIKLPKPWLPDYELENY